MRRTSMESDQAGESQLLLEKVSLFVMYVPAENKEVNVPARHRLLEAINEHGGNLLSRKDVLQPQNVGKFTALAVNRNAMPRSLPLLPGTAVYDGTWVLDCIQAGKLLPKAEYLLVQGSPPGGAQPAKAATPGRAAGPSAPRLSTVVLGDENQAEQGQRSGGGERKTPKKKRTAYTADDDRKLRDFVEAYPGAKVKGNDMWQKAEKSAILPGRSWQSMRERYTKYLMDGASKKSPAVARPPALLVGGAASPGGHKAVAPAATPADRQRANKRARPADQQAAAADDIMVDSRAIRTRMRATSERMGCPVEEVKHALMVTSGVWQDAEDFLHMEPNDRAMAVASSWTAAHDEALAQVTNASFAGKGWKSMPALLQLKGFEEEQVYDRTRFLGLFPMRFEVK